LEKSFQAWLSYKAAKKQTYKSQESVKACYSHLVNLAGNDSETAKKIIEQSMANNWAGLFELKNQIKNDGKNSSKKPTPEQLLNAVAQGIARAKHDKARREGRIDD
jgi:23S rRNA G2445 N2-methylase RlmL